MAGSFKAISLAQELDGLVRRAHLDLPDEWRATMLSEFGRMREELETIHRYAATYEGTIDVRRDITADRTEA